MYILVYYKYFSVHSVVHFTHISDTIEVVIKIHIKTCQSPNKVGQKNSVRKLSQLKLKYIISIISSKVYFFFTGAIIIDISFALSATLDVFFSELVMVSKILPRLTFWNRATISLPLFSQWLYKSLNVVLNGQLNIQYLMPEETFLLFHSSGGVMHYV